jgi:hypothetical protein
MTSMHLEEGGIFFFGKVLSREPSCCRRKPCRRLHLAAVPVSTSYEVNSEELIQDDILTTSSMLAKEPVWTRRTKEQTQPAADGGSEKRYSPLREQCTAPSSRTVGFPQPRPPPSVSPASETALHSWDLYLTLAYCPR